MAFKQATSLNESSGTALLDIDAIDETEILIEVVTFQAVDGCKFLQTSHLPGALHLALFSSNWFVRVFGQLTRSQMSLRRQIILRKNHSCRPEANNALKILTDDQTRTRRLQFGEMKCSL